MTASSGRPRPRLLCLRAPHEAASLLEGLAARGIAGQPLEVLRYQECWAASEAALPLTRGLAASDVVVLTSRRGARAWCHLCAAAGLDAATVPIAVVGEATAAEARALGLTVALVGSSDALALAHQMAVVWPQPSGRALFAVAREATVEPQDHLASLGWSVERLETYEALPMADLQAHVALLPVEAFDGVVATSANRLEAFLASATPASRDAWLRLPIIVIGQRTAERARLLGAAQVTVASGAATERLVDAAAAALRGPHDGEKE